MTEMPDGAQRPEQTNSPTSGGLIRVDVIDTETEQVVASWTSHHTDFRIADEISTEAGAQYTVTRRVWNEASRLDLYAQPSKDDV